MNLHNWTKCIGMSSSNASMALIRPKTRFGGCLEAKLELVCARRGFCTSEISISTRVVRGPGWAEPYLGRSPTQDKNVRHEPTHLVTWAGLNEDFTSCLGF